MAKVRIRTNLEVTGALGVSGSLVVSGTADIQRLLINGQELQTGSTITNVSELTNDAHYQTDTQVSASIAAAVAGFITEEQDPTVFDYIKEITEEDIASWNAKLDSSSLKTINSQSLIGPGNIVITSSAGGVTSVNGQTGSVVIDLSVYATTASVNNLTSSVNNLSSSVSNLSGSVNTLSASVASVSGLPAVTSADNGKVLMVVSGSWAVSRPVILYAGSGIPDNSLGQNGDVYFQS